MFNRMPAKNAAFYKASGARLRLAREALGLTPAQFIAPLLITKQRLSNWEQGVNGMRPEEAVKIWDEHRISPDWIFAKLYGNLPDKLAAKLRTLAIVPVADPAPAKTKRTKATP